MVDPPGPLLRNFVESCRNQRTGTVNLLLTLNRKVRDDISYVTRLEHGIQPSEETFQKRSGSCRDSAWLLVECLRNLGIAARFVSGYLIQLAEEKSELSRFKWRPSIRLRRPACLGRGFLARRRLDWIGSYLGFACRRRTHSACMHFKSCPGCSNLGHRRASQH